MIFLRDFFFSKRILVVSFSTRFFLIFLVRGPLGILLVVFRRCFFLVSQMYRSLVGWGCVGFSFFRFFDFFLASYKGFFFELVAIAWVLNFL